MNILVIDDHPEEIVPLIRIAFRGETIVCASDLMAASHEIREKKFDLIILDGNLGQHSPMTGPEWLRASKENGAALPPVVMCSADKHHLDAGIAAGAVGAIDKRNFKSIFDDFEALKKFAPNS